MERAVNPIQDALTFFDLWRLFRRERPQVVRTHSSKAGVIGRWAAIRQCGQRRTEWTVQARRLDFVRDSISVEEFLQPKPRRQRLGEWGIAEDKVVVGMVACFKPQKSPEDFIEVAARVLQKTDRAHFVMAGDGELRSSVEDRIRKHGIGEHVTLLGWQNERGYRITSLTQDAEHLAG
jgi:glycosyltransferase involved in cell wall biosynthesis